MTKLPESRPPRDGQHEVIPLSDVLQLRLEVVRHHEGGHAIGLDLRLFRRLEVEAGVPAWWSTGAGFRLPLDRTLEFAKKLLDLSAQSQARS